MLLLNNFKVGGFKVFGDTVELNMNVGSKNTTYLKENILTTQSNSKIYKNLKSSIIYGGNNTGKSSLLDALMIMKKMFNKGNLEDFPFELYKNFCFNHDDVIRLEIDILKNAENYIYGLEFIEEDTIGEYLYSNENLLFSRDLSNNYEGIYFSDLSFKNIIDSLPNDKLIIPYFLEYQKNLENYKEFKYIKEFFDKLKHIDNRKNTLNLTMLVNFMQNKRKAAILNKLIKSTELYLTERKIISEEELFKDKLFERFSKGENFEKFKKTDDYNDGYRYLIDSLRVTSVYKGRNNQNIYKPSILFDSIGTNKYLYLSMIIINALIEGEILLIDEFESSLHLKLTKILVILMNSEANNNSQFILATHDVNLLSNDLFRKDQINFIVRDDLGVNIVSLDNFKANSNKDIRNTSNFEKMYVEEKIVALPETNIYTVIREFFHE